MTFVGREPEVAAIAGALEAVGGGRGQVLLVSGEAGAGKSTLLQLVAENAAAAKMRVLWGRCSEEPGAPLFWPWIRVLRDWRTGPDAAGLNLGAHPAVGQLLAHDGLVAASGPGGPDPETNDLWRFQFFQNIAEFWRQASASGPIALVFDDLHSDSSASLKLLAVVAESIADAPVLIAGAYRNEEVAQQPALRATLGGILGRSHVRQLSLSKLSIGDSERLITLITGGDPPPRLRRALAERSDGNPLFIRELAREFLRGAEIDGGRGPALPDSIRILFEHRLERLEESTRLVLQAAAVVGRRFDTGVAAAVADAAPGVVERALEEAHGARLVGELADPGHYQFIHELLRETAYASIPPSRRMAYHRAAGEWIERRHAQALDLHLARLAHHYTRAEPAACGTRAIGYHVRAGRLAEGLRSPEQAAEHYREAVRLDLSTGGAGAAELLLALGAMEVLAGAAEVAERTFQNAVLLARAASDPAMFARAVLGLEYALWRIGRGERLLIPLLLEALAGARLPPKLAIELNSTLCRAHALAGEPDEALAAYRRAVAAARLLGDPESLFQSLRALVATRFWPELLQQRIEASREGLALAQAQGHLEWAISGTTAFLFLDLVEAGMMDEARQVAEIHREGSRRIGDRFCQLVGGHLKIMLVMTERLDPGLEDQIGLALQAGLRWSPAANATGVYGMQMFTLRRFQGRLGELRPVLRQYLAQAEAGATWGPALALLHVELGMLEEAGALFDRIARAGFHAITRDARWGISVAYLAEVCAALGDSARAVEFRAVLLPYSGRNIATTTVCLGPADRYLGLLDTATGALDEAITRFEAARSFAARCGQPIWEGYAEADLAAALVARAAPGDADRATALLHAAERTARNCAVPALRDRCLAVEARLSGPGRPRYPDGLTQGEIKVLRLLAAGATNKAISRDLTLSPHTVAAHVRNILGKTGTANRTEAANYARRKGLVEEGAKGVHH